MPFELSFGRCRIQVFGNREGCQDSPGRMWVVSEAWQMEGAVGGKARPVVCCSVD